LRKLSGGRAARSVGMGVVVFGAAFSALSFASIIFRGSLGYATIDVDMFLLSFGSFCYLLHSCTTNSQGNNNKVNTAMFTKSFIGKVVFPGMRRVCRADSVEKRGPLKTQGNSHGNSKVLGEQLGHGRRRPRFDVYMRECVQREGVPHTLAKVSEVMRVSIRLGSRITAVKLFDQMLKKGAVPDAHLIDKAVSNNFFQLVVDTLDDKRIQTDGLALLDLIWAHGIEPSPSTQNCLLSAWKDQPPERVVEYFVKMKSAGITLSNWACRSVVVAYGRSDPAFVLKVSNEMERSGIQLQRKAYIAVLGACLQLGMRNKAEELFMKMADHEVAPIAKIYGIMVKVYSFSCQFGKAIAVFDAMREQSFEPDRCSYHHAIRSCVASGRVEYAVELYRDAVQAKVCLFTSTCGILRRACSDGGWKCLASKFKELPSQQITLMNEAEVA